MHTQCGSVRLRICVTFGTLRPHSGAKGPDGGFLVLDAERSRVTWFRRSVWSHR